MKLRAARCVKMVHLGWILVASCHAADTPAPARAQITSEFDQRVWRHEHGLPAGDRVWSILQTRDGYLWAATQRGLARFDGQRFTIFNRINTPELADDECRTLAEDLEGNLWIATRGSLIRKTGRRFTLFTYKLGSPYIGAAPLCASRGGGVWVGGQASLSRIQGDRVLTTIRDPDAPIGPSLSTAIKEDSDGMVWLGTETGLFRFDPRSGRFEVGEREPNHERAPVLDLWLAPSGDLWICFAEYLYPGHGPLPSSWIACLQPGQWPKAPTVHLRFTQPGSYCPAIMGDRAGDLRLLGGTPGAIRRYRNGELESLQTFQRKSTDESLSAGPDREGNLWIGVDRSGLQRLSPRKITSFTTGDGLAHDNVWSIFEGQDGSMWIGTAGGVTRFKDGQSTLLTRADGSIQRDVRAVAEDREGTLWVGTMRSLEYTRNGETKPVEFPGEWFETKIRALHPGRDGSMWVGTVRGLTALNS